MQEMGQKDDRKTRCALPLTCMPAHEVVSGLQYRSDHVLAGRLSAVVWSGHCVRAGIDCGLHAVERLIWPSYQTGMPLQVSILQRTPAPDASGTITIIDTRNGGQSAKGTIPRARSPATGQAAETRRSRG